MTSKIHNRSQPTLRSKVGGSVMSPPDRPIARPPCPFRRFACIEAPLAWRVLSTRIIRRRKTTTTPKSVFQIYINIYIYVYINITIYVVLSIHIHFSGRRSRTAARRQIFAQRGAERRLLVYLSGWSRLSFQRRHACLKEFFDLRLQLSVTAWRSAVERLLLFSLFRDLHSAYTYD